MINKQFSKCPYCGKEEKYINWVKVGNDVKKIKCCKDRCMLDSKGNK